MYIENKYYINYVSFIPVLIEAVKEQQNTIVDLHNKLEEMNKLLGITDKGAKKEKSSPLLSGNDLAIKATLYQNQPNPFDESTTISAYIPDNAIDAVLYIYDMQGLQKNNINILTRGEVELTIYGNTLKPGMYMYTLIVDGKEVDTKRMILTN